MKIWNMIKWYLRNKKTVFILAAVIAAAFLVYAIASYDPLDRFVYKPREEQQKTIEALRKEIRDKDTTIFRMIEDAKKAEKAIANILKDQDYWMEKYYAERLTPEQILKLRNIKYYEILPANPSDSLIKHKLDVLLRPAAAVSTGASER